MEFSSGNVERLEHIGPTAGQGGNSRFGKIQNMQGPGGNKNLRLKRFAETKTVSS